MAKPPKIKFGTNGDDELDGMNKSDLIFGFGGDDLIVLGGGNDTAFGGRGDDRIEGGNGHDNLHGGRGDDLLDGGEGNDDIFGDDGNDGLVGGKGNDDLYGGGGRDFLLGGAGHDDLHGGAGSDKFVMRVGSGVDTVKDLQSIDRIDLRDFNFASAQDAINAFQQVGHKAVLNLGGGDKLVLEHTDVDDLATAQFIVSDAETGVSSSQSPYVLGVDPSISTVSLLTVGDQTSDGTGWQMVGIPDGLGAFDNEDGTFTVLMNHELSPTQGVARDHGGIGAFVSKLIIDKTTLEVLAGSDQIQTVYLYDTATDSFYDPVNDGNPLTLPYQFDRLCSADLAPKSAFYNAETGLGYDGRIFMNGEEDGPPFSTHYGLAFAHFVGGAEDGNSYEFTGMGKYAHENVVANPHTGDKTVIASMDDATPGQVYFYFGDKQAAGTALDKAGLTGGTLFGLKVDELDTLADLNNEGNSTTLGGDFESTFSLVDLGDATETTGADMQTQSEAGEVTEFLRPEDGAWDTVNHDRFYFTTTNAFGSASRLWAVDFVDASNPNAGGTIKMLLDGSEGQQMLDNLTVNRDGKVLLQEDVGNNAHLGKIWEYDPANDSLTLLAQHDPDRFVAGGSNFLTQDEESSGIIDISDILGSGGQNAYLLDVQAHYNIAGELVQGGQLMVMYQDLV